MIFEIQVMLAIGFLYWLLGQLPVPTKTRIAGVGWNLGNRDRQPEFPAWTQRCERAQRNLLESLPLYYALAVAIQCSAASNSVTHGGAWLFLAGRCAHALIFIAGIPTWRTLAYIVSMIGLALMGSQLI